MRILPQPSKDLYISGKNYVKKRKKERFILRSLFERNSQMYVYSSKHAQIFFKVSHLLVCMHLNHKYSHIVWAHNNTESIVYLGQKTKTCKEKSQRQNSINTFEK